MVMAKWTVNVRQKIVEHDGKFHTLPYIGSSSQRCHTNVWHPNLCHTSVWHKLVQLSFLSFLICHTSCDILKGAQANMSHRSVTYRQAAAQVSSNDSYESFFLLFLPHFTTNENYSPEIIHFVWTQLTFPVMGTPVSLEIPTQILEKISFFSKILMYTSQKVVKIVQNLKSSPIKP